MSSYTTSLEFLGFTRCRSRQKLIIKNELSDILLCRPYKYSLILRGKNHDLNTNDFKINVELMDSEGSCLVKGVFERITRNRVYIYYEGERIYPTKLHFGFYKPQKFIICAKQKYKVIMTYKNNEFYHQENIRFISRLLDKKVYLEHWNSGTQAHKRLFRDLIYTETKLKRVTKIKRENDSESFKQSRDVSKKENTNENIVNIPLIDEWPQQSEAQSIDFFSP